MTGLDPTPPPDTFASVVDWAQIVGAVGSVLALLLAVGAIVYSACQAKANAQLIADERHTAFQLNLLEDLLDLTNEVPGHVYEATNKWRAAHARLRVVDAPLPYFRARYRVYPTDEKRREALGVPAGAHNVEDAFVDSAPTDVIDADGKPTTVRNRLFDEITTAISTLVGATPAQIRAMREEAEARRKTGS